MTVTDTAPEATTVAPEPTPSTPTATVSPGGLAGVVGSGDHKVIGRLYVGFSALFGIASLVAGLLVAIDRVDGEPGNTILTSSTFNQVFTLQTTGLVFLFLVPLLLGIAVCVVPLQVGSRSIAFPRAAAASFWTWLIGSGALVASYAINGGPGGGELRGVGLWAASFALLLAGLVLGAICVVTTVIALRAPGLTLDRAPLFSWSMLTAGVVWILSLPVLIATLGLIYVDHRYGQRSFGLNGPGMFTRVDWAFRQPQLYAFAAPVLGLMGDVVPVAGRTRQPNREVAMGAIGVFSVMGFGAFLQSTIYPAASVQPVYVAMAIVAMVAVLALFGGWGSTLTGGRPRLISPLVFGVAAVLSLLLATVGGAASSIERLDLQGTVFELGQADLVVFAAVTGAIGALWWWATKIAGRQLPEGLGLLAATVLLLGTLATALPYGISGAFGDGSDATNGIEGLNAVSAVGYGLMLLGVVLGALGLLAALRPAPTAAPADPWEGHTLEWASASPPAGDNFTEIPPVESAEPLLDSHVAGTDDSEEAPA